ncbi:CARDB domain-containing protein [Nocardioides zhouii]|uniref:DUF11 domain-containing protein n=1 Tax=Nocardioides zhouii TaxID=1168729 RepID=A0A4Q2T0F8_9ACTN|nr:CARDB domain-containing protein [Nocardioides zhouii]RYC11453.1 DUF11 domain-containing protein [Nocardioides zhouii]
MPDTRSSRPARFRALVVAMALAVVAAFLAAVTVPAQADASPFVVTMTPSSNPVSSGSSLTYTIDVKNGGGDITEDTFLSTQISGMTGLIITSNVGTCEQSGEQVTCHAGTLSGQQSWRLIIRGTVTAPNGATLHNGVTVTGNHESSGYETTVYSDVLVSNTSSSPLADLRVSVSGPSVILDNSQVTYTLTVNNSGNAHATDVVVINTLPDGTTVASSSATSLFSCSSAAQTTTCVGGRVNAGTNATITILANVASPDDLNQFKDTAVVDPYDAIEESNELNNTGSLVSTNGAPPAQTGGLTILKTGTPDVLRPGDKITYTLLVSNTAATRADNVSITDVTQGLNASSITATTTAGACTVTAPQVVCTRKSPTLRLEPGQTITVTITGTVTSQAGTLITNVGTVTGVIKNKSVTNTSRSTATIRPGYDLTVVQFAHTNHEDADDTPGATDPFRAWDHFQYDVAVGNSGLDTATNVLLREVVAPGVLFLGDNRGDVLCNQAGGAGNPIICTFPSIVGATNPLPGGSVEFITLNVVSPHTPGTIDATATVDPANAIFEADETNNVWKISTPIVTGIDLYVEKSSESPIAPSGTLTYTVLVKNLGTQDATGVTIKDTLPAGVRFRSVQDDPSDPHNFTCSHDGAATGGDVTCVGGRIDGTHDHFPDILAPEIDVATITIVVFAPSQPGFVRNQVRVDPANEIAELLETNNINTFRTEIQIDGGLHPYHEFNLTKTQVSPLGGVGNPVAPNGIVEYDLVVTNTGSDVAFDVQVDDIMPAGFTFRYAVDTLPGTGDFQCDLVASTIRCTGGTLDGDEVPPPGQTAQLGDTTRTIHVSMFSAGQPGTYTNKALVDPNNTHPEADETNNSAQAITTVAVGGGGRYKDLTIDSKQAAPVGDVAPSGTLRYTLDVSNTGTAVAFNVKVRDTLPEGSVFRTAVDSAPGAGAFECTGAGGIVTCTGGTLDGNVDETTSPSTRQIVIEVFAPPEPGNYLNTAIVDPDDAIAENDELNNTDTTPLQVRMGGGGLYRDLTIDDPIVTNVTYGPVSLREPKPSQVYTYTVKATNTGTNPAYNVVVRHVLEDGATFLNATADQDFSCTIAANVVLCDGGVLDGTPGFDAAGPTATFTLTVRAPARHNYVYGLTSRVDPGNVIAEANEANNSRSLNVKAVSQVDLTVDITDVDGTQGNPGSVTWKALATGDDASNVYVVVELPVGVIPQNMTTVPTGWTCQIQQNPINKVTCHGDLAKDDATVEFKVDTYVTATTTTANAFIDPDNTVVEYAEGNNADSES